MRSLYEAIRQILDNGRVGVPVFTRFTVQIAPEDGHVENVLARILTMTCSWMEAKPLRVYALSQDDSKHLTAFVHYADGQTAIVSVTTVPYHEHRMYLMILGNKGALYHDMEVLPPGFEITTEPLPIQEWLMHAVNRSISTGKPVFFER